ncbi:XRE family transcriptional regulator [Gordonia jinhuaensis]|uniref:XRE family transcriptional regulator n=1 Tax=Gordonia jinhuaensis TaxID=1517702 RepID=A0A916T443_9ACTN|nr:XRE family transcriptional regulator [Gordonia jinhuaensis]
MALDTPDPVQESLGAEIRRRRKELGLTLTAVAEQAGISHPFLSQLERGYARPSMLTLERIARALGTTQVRLMLSVDTAQAARDDSQMPAGVDLVRADAGVHLPQADDGDTAGYSRLLVRGTASFYPQEQVQRRRVFGEFYRHPQDEWVHVVEGAIEVDLDDGRPVELRAGDSLYYAGGIPHRWRVIGDATARLIVVQAS